MGRENKKEAVAALHREQIVNAAETLFAEKGYAQTTIEDISGASGYSRRTLYAYYVSKEDILARIVEKGLEALLEDVEKALSGTGDFLAKYRESCGAMKRYREDYPYSAESVISADARGVRHAAASSETVRHILGLGNQINERLADFIRKGQQDGVVRKDVIPMLTVQIMWSQMTALLALVKGKEEYLTSQYAMSEEEVLDYGFRQIANAVLEVRI